MNVSNRTPSEFLNDKNILNNSEKMNNGNYILDISTFNKLSKQTRHYLSKYITFHGNYVTISNNTYLNNFFSS